MENLRNTIRSYQAHKGAGVRSKNPKIGTRGLVMDAPKMDFILVQDKIKVNILPGIFKVAKHTFTKISNIQKCPQRRQSMLKIEKLMQFYRKCI